MYTSFTLDTISKGNQPLIQKPCYDGHKREAASLTKLAESLTLIKHPNGGYFKETDRSGTIEGQDHAQSSLIHYLMTCESPVGQMHHNKTGRSIHILQKGRAVYVLIYPDGNIKSFVVGFNTAKGELTQWVVPANVWKGCYIIPEEGRAANNEDCLWASEVVVPGFDFQDMVMMDKERLAKLVGDQKANELEFLLEV